MTDHESITADTADTAIHALAFAEPRKDIADHVWAAHEAQKQRQTQHGRATAEITFKPEIGAFELVTESRDIADLLRGLGAGAKITIHF